MYRSRPDLEMRTIQATQRPTRHGPRRAGSADANGIDRLDAGGALVLSSSLLTDRMLLHSGFLKHVVRQCPVTVWATSAASPSCRDIWNAASGANAEFPDVQPFKEFPYNYLRRLNEFAWDFAHRSPSRLSMLRHVRDKQLSLQLRALKLPARFLAALRLERVLERGLERLLLAYPRSEEASRRLQKQRPALVLTTGPFWFTEPAVAAAAKQLGIPTMALIPSWDNLTTKGRMVFQYDGYLVWSRQMERELHAAYPDSRKVPTYVVGAPQFDVFFDARYHWSRAEFCERFGLRPDWPIILYAIGSPNFIRGEYHGALYMAEKVDAGVLGEAQLLVRPHPNKDNGEIADLFRHFSSRVVLQRVSQTGIALAHRSQNQDDVKEWVNTFRHADVVVNLASTATIDGAIFDRPVVNLDFDPDPKGSDQALIKDINHLWAHFKPIAESGGVWTVGDRDELVEAVGTYLKHPELHREQRRWMAEYVCQYLDGRCGERMAQAVLDFLREHTGKERLPERRRKGRQLP